MYMITYIEKNPDLSYLSRGILNRENIKIENNFSKIKHFAKQMIFHV